ncbi:MAG: Uma2 family endonuclease [Nostoc sp.]|uniref:Uma2 family endonuclease n=1 Tax=Nostoc sp. TaxID=1180 RepID=UPI002FF9263C
MTTTIKIVNPNIEYPSSDGEPLAESYLHLYAILTTLEVIKQYLAGRQATVLADQFLYYAQGFPKLRVAPDVMVILDVPPGGRDNYKVWEEGQVPQVVFEMTSQGTQKQDQEQKKNLYEQLGILEYWLFDPKGEWIEEKLRGYRLEDETYQLITDGISQPLGLTVAVEGELLGFYRLDTGEKLLTPTELAEQLQQERQRADKLAEYLRSQGIDPNNLP